MKRIVSLVLMLTMLFSIAVVNTSAAGLYVKSDFNDMERFTASFHAGAYYTEDGLLFGYDEAKCLQTKGEWYVYDTSITVILNDDELTDNHRAYSLWYCNTNLMNYGRFDGTNYMCFGYDVEDRFFYLRCTNVDGSGDSVELVNNVPYELEDDTEYTFGMSITRGRIRGFINNELVVDYVDSADTYLIGLQDESTVPVPLVFWNDGNFIQIKEVQISSPEYLFPPVNAPESSENNGQASGNITSDNTIKPAETTTSIKVVENTDGDGNVITDEAGNKVTETIIITDPPVADTNTGAPQGGNATSTGDSAVIVVAAMVATLGCALIVKKVYIG